MGTFINGFLGHLFDGMGTFVQDNNEHLSMIFKDICSVGQEHLSEFVIDYVRKIFITPVYYTGNMGRTKVLQDEKRVEILVPHKLLNLVDEEADSFQTNRSRMIRKILAEYFKEKMSSFTSTTSQNTTINVLLGRLDNIDEKLNSINARVKIIRKRARR